MGTLFQAAAYLGFVLSEQIVDELLAGIVRNALGWVHQTQGRRRYYRLLDLDVGVEQSGIQIMVGVSPVTERGACEPGQAARVAVCERDFEAIRGDVRKPMHGVRREIVIFPLFAIGNDGGTGGFKPLNRLSNRIFIEGEQVGILAVAFGDPLDQIKRSRATADWLGWYGHRPRLGHTDRLLQL